MTIFFVPHMALGAELSNDYHERSRLFGLRRVFTFGSILSLATMYWLITEEFRMVVMCAPWLRNTRFMPWRLSLLRCMP